MLEQYLIGVISKFDIEKQEIWLHPHIDRNKCVPVSMHAAYNVVKDFFLKTSRFEKSPFFGSDDTLYTFAGLYDGVPVFADMSVCDDGIVVSKQEIFQTASTKDKD